MSIVTSLLKPEIKAFFDKSVESELYAQNLYRHLANQMQRMGFFGAQSYFLKESAEEGEHYQKIVDYVNDMGAVATVMAVPKITDPILSIQDALELSYETELSLMKQYQDFYEMAEESGDCVTATFLIEFLQIQRKSVGAYGDFISRLQGNPVDVFEFDDFMMGKD